MKTNKEIVKTKDRVRDLCNDVLHVLNEEINKNMIFREEEFESFGFNCINKNDVKWTYRKDGFTIYLNVQDPTRVTLDNGKYVTEFIIESKRSFIALLLMLE